MPATTEATPTTLPDAINALEIALPAPGSDLEQDEEWAVVKVDGDWRRIRLHDYAEVYQIQGLYEKWIYEVFQCRSPEKIRELLQQALAKAGKTGDDLTVLDLGAGNGYVADELRKIGATRFVAIDIHDSARDAATRDRPGLYADYVVDDMTDVSQQSERTLAAYKFNCLTCVAALGFGDIPPQVFAAAFNRIADAGWAAFTIKKDFLDERDASGFSRLIRRMLSENVLELSFRESYVHRICTDATELVYEALVGRKLRPIPTDWSMK